MIGSRWYVVILLTVLYVISYIDRVIVTLMVQPLRAEFGISDTQIGLLIGPAFAVLFALVSLPLAWLIDRGNRKRYLLFGVTLWSLCTTLAGFATSYPMLLGLRMGLAVGEAVLTPIAISLIGDMFANGERSKPTAIYVSSSMVGVVLAYIAGAAILDLTASGMLAHLPGLGTLSPWRLSLVLVGLPGLMMAIVIMLTVREPSRTRTKSGQDTATPVNDERFGLFGSLREAVQFYSPAILGPALLCAILNGAVAWYPTYLIRSQGVSASDAGLIFSLAVLGGIVPLLLIPTVAERIARTGRRDLLLFVPLFLIPVGILFFVLALLQSSLLWAAILMIVGYSLMAGATGLPQVAIPLVAPPMFRARAIAMMTFANNIIGLGLGVFLVGFMSDRIFSGPGSLGSALLAIALIAGPAAWLSYLLAWRPYRAAASRPMSQGLA